MWKIEKGGPDKQLGEPKIICLKHSLKNKQINKAMAQQMKHLPCRSVDLSSSPKSHIKAKTDNLLHKVSGLSHVL